jgi:hypothetical protein
LYLWTWLFEETPSSVRRRWARRGTWSNPDESITVTKIVSTFEYAEPEVSRLNPLNA